MDLAWIAAGVLAILLIVILTILLAIRKRRWSEKPVPCATVVQQHQQVDDKYQNNYHQQHNYSSAHTFPSKGCQSSMETSTLTTSTLMNSSLTSNSLWVDRRYGGTEDQHPDSGSAGSPGGSENKQLIGGGGVQENEYTYIDRASLSTFRHQVCCNGHWTTALFSSLFHIGQHSHFIFQCPNLRKERLKTLHKSIELFGSFCQFFMIKTFDLLDKNHNWPCLSVIRVLEGTFQRVTPTPYPLSLPEVRMPLTQPPMPRQT